MSIIAENKVASVHYTGTFPDSDETFDSSRGKDPLSFLVGHRNMIPGFENALMGAAVGDTVTFTLAPEDAYGVAAIRGTVATVLWGLEKVETLEQGLKAAEALWEARDRQAL